MIYTKQFFMILFSLIILTYTNVPYGVALDWDQRFSEQINFWINEIAKNDSIFVTWLGTSWTSQSLGPNSKQWLITINKENDTVGHLIVGEDERGELFIVEFGLGAYNVLSKKFDKKGTAYHDQAVP